MSDGRAEEDAISGHDPTADEGWHDVRDAEDPNVPEKLPSTEHGGGEGKKGADVHHDVFHLVHSRKATDGTVKRHIHEHGFDVPVKFAHLFKRPVVRQWIHEGNVYREKDERIPSRFELFFDLMFVGIAHVLADTATKQATGFNVLKFVLEYFPSWSVWMDVRTFMNVSGTDDVKERLGLLAYMIMLNGFSSNAASLRISKVGSPEDLNMGQDGWDGINKRAMPDEACDNPSCVDYYLGSGYWLEDGYLDALYGAVGFYLVIWLVRVLLYLVYGWMLPNFRPALWMNALVRALISVIYIPLMFVWSAPMIVILMVVGMVLEIMNPFIVLYALRLYNALTIKWTGRRLYLPALSLEHAMERTTQFVIVATGETIISATFSATNEHGLSIKFGRSSLGICCSFFLIWLYYDADSSRTFQHALRRHTITSSMYSLLHFPLTATLILLGSSLTQLINIHDHRDAYLWFWSGSLATYLSLIGLMGLLHRNLDRQHSTLLPRWTRITLRFIVALLVLFLPLMRKQWHTIDFLGVNTALLFFLVAFETITKVGAVGRRYDPERAKLVHRAKRSSKTRTDPSAAEAMYQARAELEKMGAVRTPKFTYKLNKGPRRLRLKRSLSWHPYENLTQAETGEEDVGMESELGHLQVKELSAGQRWAYFA